MQRKSCAGAAAMASSPREARPRVLLTRPRADSERLAPGITALGAECLIWPLTEIVPTREAVALPSGTAALVFTSANGVAAFAGLSPERGLPAFCVGDRTAQAAQVAGFTQVASAGGTVDDLAVLLGESATGAVFYPRGRDVAADLAGLAAARGIAVTEQVVYAAATGGPPPAQVVHALADGTIDIIAVFSRRAGTLLAGRFAEHPAWARAGTDVIAISKKASEPLVAAGFRHVFVADAPDAVAMLRAVSAALRQKDG